MVNQFQACVRIPSSRLPGWDYATPDMYFVTVCTKDMRCYFGKVVDGKMFLNKVGEIAHQNWLSIPSHNKNVNLDSFIINPNHMHGILILSDWTENPETHPALETWHATSLRNSKSSDYYANISPKKGSLSAVIRSYKSATTRSIRIVSGGAFSWRARFYDHIIRTKTYLDNLRLYIQRNPQSWLQENNLSKSR